MFVEFNILTHYKNSNFGDEAPTIDKTYNLTEGFLGQGLGFFRNSS